MTADELIKQQPEEIIATLEAQRPKDYKNNLNNYKAQLDPCQHDIVVNKFDRKDRYRRVVHVDSDGVRRESTEIDRVNRIALPLQQIIVERAVAFLFGNDVKVTAIGDDEALAQAVTDALISIGKDNKIDSFNRKLARSTFSVTEAAEYWYSPEGKNIMHNRYGFNTTARLRCQLFSPLKGDYLYPYFDNFGDMTAFGREFTIKDDRGNDLRSFELWTDKKYYRWVNDGGWTQQEERENKLGAIPIVYYAQETPEYYGVQILIERVEKLLSNTGDTNDRHARPILAAKGRVENMIGDFVQLDEGADVHYVSWDQGTASVREEVEILLNLIYSLSQTPNISFEAVKGIGNLSGVSLKMLFLDAHLKVRNKQELFEEGLIRRYNILKRFLAQINPAWGEKVNHLEVDIKITPYIIGNETESIENITTLYSSKQISLQRALELNPYVDNPDIELQRIKDEAAEREESAEGLDDVMNEEE